MEKAIRVGQAIEPLRQDDFGNPTWGPEGIRRLRQCVRIPLATNAVVVNFERLVQMIRHDLLGVALLDTAFPGGLCQSHKAGAVLETFQYCASGHSSGELGIRPASMLHLGAARPNLCFAVDAHCHHLTDYIIIGGKMACSNGCISLPKGPALGVKVDGDKIARYAELYRELGGYPCDRDPPGLAGIPSSLKTAMPARLSRTCPRHSAQIPTRDLPKPHSIVSRSVVQVLAEVVTGVFRLGSGFLHQP